MSSYFVLNIAVERTEWWFECADVASGVPSPWNSIWKRFLASRAWQRARSLVSYIWLIIREMK